MGGLANVLSAYQIKLGHFSLVAKSVILKQLGATCTQLLYGVLRPGPAELILGYPSGYGFATIRLARNIVADIATERPTIRQLGNLARSHSTFPQFNLPATILNSVNLNGTRLVIASMFGITAADLYALSDRLVNLPTSMFGASITSSY